MFLKYEDKRLIHNLLQNGLISNINYDLSFSQSRQNLVHFKMYKGTKKISDLLNGIMVFAFFSIMSVALLVFFVMV